VASVAHRSLVDQLDFKARPRLYYVLFFALLAPRHLQELAFTSLM